MAFIYKSSCIKIEIKSEKRCIQFVLIRQDATTASTSSQRGRHCWTMFIKHTCYRRMLHGQFVLGVRCGSTGEKNIILLSNPPFISFAASSPFLTPPPHNPHTRIFVIVFCYTVVFVPSPPPHPTFARLFKQ